MTRRRILPLGAVVLATLAVVAVLSRSEPSAHRVAFVVPDAASLFPGLQVRAAGLKIGSIDAVETIDGGRSARVVLKITDDKVWPLPKDSRVTGRFGGTVASFARYIQVERGTASGTPYADGATLPAANVRMPVEIGSIVDVFDPTTRRDLRSTLDAAGEALKPAEEPLRRSLGVAPAATQKLEALFSDLAVDRAGLSQLVASTDRVVAAANRAEVGPLITDTATTLTAINSRAGALQRTLDNLPDTLSLARTTLKRADGTLTQATAVTDKLDPGIRNLRAITPPLNRALGTVTDIAPDAISTLGTVRKSAPRINRLLRSTTRLMPSLQSALKQAEPQLTCVRPYAPEIAGFASTWASFTSQGDGKDKYARLYFGTYPFPNGTTLTVPEAAKMVPSAFAGYAFPRAPGANVGKPWYQPDCNITADGADPQKNPEAKAFDPFSRKLTKTDPAG